MQVKVKPSGAYQWGNCSGSPAAISRCRDDDSSSDARELGIATHELISTCLTSAMDPTLFIGQPMSNGIVVTDEMVQCSGTMIEAVAPYMSLEHIVEQEIHMPQILTGHRGYVDFAAYDRVNAIVYAFEYKNGHGHVDAFENHQLIDYSIGLVNHWGITTAVTFVFKVVQPRSYSGSGPVREWRATSFELMPMYEKLRRSAAEAVGPNPRLSTGKHCRTCPAVGICTAARKASYNVIDYSNDPLEVDEMDDIDLGVEYELMQRSMGLLKKRFEAIEDEVKYRVSEGSTQTGYSVERNPGKWVWQDDNESVIDSISTMFGVNPETKSVKTVAQVRQALPAKVRKAFDSVRPTLAKRKEGSDKLIPISETRAAKVFGGKSATS